MRQARWQSLTEWPLAIAAAAFLAAYAWSVLAALTGPARVVTDTIITLTWAVFLIDYLVRLALAKQRWRWFYTHLVDLAIVVLPFFRPLRLIRLVSLVSLLQRTAGKAFRGRVVASVIGASVLLVFVAGLAILDAERAVEGSLITNFGDALWWAIATITTVGYGDLYPVTVLGRFIATAVMIGGIALLGVVTATLASWIVEKVTEGDSADDAVTRSQLTQLAEEVRMLRRQLERAPGESD